jgi:signal transduction histidine kinase
MVLLLQFWMPAMAWAADAGTLDTWRRQVSQTRQLAENDAPAALREAQRLQRTLPADAAPADRARVLNLQSRIENYLMRTEQAMVHAQQAQALASQYGDRVGQAEADLNLAMIAVSQGRLAWLDEIVPHCMEILEGTDRPELLSEAMMLSAAIYRRKGLIENSVAMAMRALELAQHEHNPMALAQAHWSLATLFSLSNRAEEARDHATRMREQARIYGSRRLEAAALVEWGRASAKLGDMREAEQRIHNAIDINRRAGMPAAVAANMSALAEVLHQQGRTADAIKLLDEVIGIYKAYSHKTGLWSVLSVRSEYKQALGVNGEPDAEQAMELARDIGMPMYLVKSEQRLAAVTASRDDWKAAYRHAAQAARLLEARTNDSSGEHMMMLAKRYEKDSEQRRIEALTRDIERQQLRQRWMLTILGGGGLILAGALLFLWSQRRSRQRVEESNRQLQLSQDRLRENERLLRALAERNEAIREAERRHLAREVHDELGQMLNVVRLNLLVLDRRFGRDNPEMHGVVGTMLDHLGNTIAMARNIVSALHPAVLDAGIAVALEWLLQEFGKSTGIAHTLAVSREVALDDAQAMAVYRIVQESLTNVARHSGADLIEVSLMLEDALYRLEITDNGHGFDVSAPRNLKSLGLIGMQERALMLGGRLELKSLPGEGVLLRMDFPVQREEEFA